MNMCSLTGCKGGVLCMYHSDENLKVKRKWMARPVQNAAVCRVNDESSLN